MTDSSRYPSTPIGLELSRFFNHRSLLRRTIPLFSMTWKDFGRTLKGEAAMIHNTPSHQGHDKGHGGSASHHDNHLHARA